MPWALIFIVTLTTWLFAGDGWAVGVLVGLPAAFLLKGIAIRELSDPDMRMFWLVLVGCTVAGLVFEV